VKEACFPPVDSPSPPEAAPMDKSVKKSCNISRPTARVPYTSAITAGAAGVLSLASGGAPSAAGLGHAGEG